MLHSKFDIIVLYVENDNVSRNQSIEILEQYFTKVIVANSGSDALDKYHNHLLKNTKPIELLITNIEMPVMNGFELIQRLRKIDSRLHAIITSSINCGPYIKEITDISILNDYLAKPIDSNELYKIIKKSITAIEERRIEKNQRYIIEQFKNALDASAIVSKTDLKGNITYVNDAFCKISGYSKEELLGKKHNILRHSDVPCCVYKELWTTLKSKNIFKYQNLANIAKDGNTYYVNITIIPILDFHGKTLEYISIRFDTSELQRAVIKERKAKEAQTMFLANMSHEIRTPLNGILGFAEILGDSVLPKKEAEYIDIINSSASSLLNTVNEILDISKIETGNLKVEKRDFELYNELSIIKKLFVKKANEKNIKFSYNLSDNFLKTIVTSSDSSRIKQVLNNLLFNAIKFTPNNGIVSLDLTVKNRNEKNIKIEFSVKDNGIGIEKNRQKDIFKAFIQESQSTTREYGGTGLGLTICKNLIALLGSELKLESRKNEGSRFYFELEFEYKNLEKNEESSKKKIVKKFDVDVLVVEDVEINRKLMNTLLTKKGIRVTFANNGLEAVRIFEKDYNKFSMVLMDINMPIMDGLEACTHLNFLKKIKKIDNLPIIALTANVVLGDKNKFLENGFDDYISKPIDTNRLRSTLVKYLKFSNNINFENEDKIALEKQINETSVFKNKVIFDKNIILNNSKKMDIPEEFYLELLNDFLLIVDDEINKLKISFDKNEHRKFIDISHRNKGVCGNLVLTRLYEIFSIFENKKILAKDFENFLNEINENVLSLKEIYYNYIK